MISSNSCPLNLLLVAKRKFQIIIILSYSKVSYLRSNDATMRLKFELNLDPGSEFMRSGLSLNRWRYILPVHYHLHRVVNSAKQIAVLFCKVITSLTLYAVFI